MQRRTSRTGYSKASPAATGTQGPQQEPAADTAGPSSGNGADAANSRNNGMWLDVHASKMSTYLTGSAAIQHFFPQEAAAAASSRVGKPVSLWLPQKDGRVFEFRTKVEKKLAELRLDSNVAHLVRDHLGLLHGDRLRLAVQQPSGRVVVVETAPERDPPPCVVAVGSRNVVVSGAVASRLLGPVIATQGYGPSHGIPVHPLVGDEQQQQQVLGSGTTAAAGGPKCILIKCYLTYRWYIYEISGILRRQHGVTPTDSLQLSAVVEVAAPDEEGGPRVTAIRAQLLRNQGASAMAGGADNEQAGTGTEMEAGDEQLAQEASGQVVGVGGEGLLSPSDLGPPSAVAAPVVLSNPGVAGGISVHRQELLPRIDSQGIGQDVGAAVAGAVALNGGQQDNRAAGQSPAGPAAAPSRGQDDTAAGQSPAGPAEGVVQSMAEGQPRQVDQTLHDSKRRRLDIGPHIESSAPDRSSEDVFREMPGGGLPEEHLAEPGTVAVDDSGGSNGAAALTGSGGGTIVPLAPLTGKSEQPNEDLMNEMMDLAGQKLDSKAASSFNLAMMKLYLSAKDEIKGIYYIMCRAKGYEEACLFLREATRRILDKS